MTQPATATRRGRSPVMLTLLLLAGAGIAVALILASGLGDHTDPPAAAGGALPDPSLGEDGAPVEVVEYSDFRCPYCGQFARETKPELVERYVEPGVVRYVWRDLPYQGEASRRAALAARAAQEQGAFWEYHAELFAGQDQGASDERLRAIAEDLDLDLDDFDEALEDERHAEAVQAGVDRGQELGLTGTPAFTVNGQVIIGAQPLEVFVEAIEAAAAS